MNMKRLLALMMALAMMVGLLAACGSSTDSDDTSTADSTEETSTETTDDSSSDSTEGTTLTIGIVSTSGGFDHVGTHGQSDDLNTYLAWDSLFKQDAETGEMVPCMVDTYEWIDETHLRLTLKEGITAADGEEITAEDALYSLKRYYDEDSNLISFVEQYDFDNSYVDEDDPLTFVLAFTEEFGPGIRYLYLPIVPMDWATTGEGAEDATWWDSPNSTGPYTCVENVDGAYVTFQLRDDYYGDTTGMADFITIRYYGEESTMYIDYQNGVLDACFGLSSDDATSLEGVEGSTVVIQSENDIYMLVLPEYVEQFDDENVRMAVAHAIDYEQVAVAGFGELWTACDSILPTNVSYHISTDLPYEYDVEYAKELMAASAYPDGFDLTVVVTNSDENINMMTVIQAYLAEIGINITIESYDIATAVPMLQAGESGLTLNHGMGGNPQLEPAISLQNYCSTTTNLSVMISDEDWNTWLDLGLHSVDEDTRAEAYEAMQEWAVDAYRLLPVCESGYAYAYHDTIAYAACAAPSAPDLTQWVMAD